MTLRKAIETVPDWQSLTAAELFSALTDPSVEYVDLHNYTWGGIADVLGNDTTELLNKALDEQGSSWAARALSGTPGLQLSRPEIQEKLYALDQYGIVPGAAKLAEHVRRNISILESLSIEPSFYDVANELAEMQLELVKQEIEDEWQDRLQAARERLTVWDGDPDTEPTL